MQKQGQRDATSLALKTEERDHEAGNMHMLHGHSVFVPDVPKN